MQGWRVYLRVTGGELLELAEIVAEHTQFARPPERMFDGQMEFEIVDPDGHPICVADVCDSRS